MDKITDEVLLDYIDGVLEDNKADFLKKNLLEDEKLHSRFLELKRADEYLSGTLESPSKNFTDAVWTKISISGENARFSLNGLLIVLTAMITVVLGSYFITDSIIELDLDIGIPNMLSEYVKVPQMDMPEGINLKTISQALLYGISFLLLLILDKAILKPYFKRRKELLGSH